MPLSLSVSSLTPVLPSFSTETTAALHSHEALWPGVYDVLVQVADEQGLACPDKEVFRVEVCTCPEGGDCRSRLMGYAQTPSSQLSAPAISLLLTAALLLLRGWSSLQHIHT